jgi:hypothetical protein
MSFAAAAGVASLFISLDGVVESPQEWLPVPRR